MRSMEASGGISDFLKGDTTRKAFSIDQGAQHELGRRDSIGRCSEKGKISPEHAGRREKSDVKGELYPREGRGRK